MAVLKLRTGCGGTGKTYSCVYDLTHDFLINSNGLYITNLPLNIEAIAEYVSKKTGHDASIYAARIVLIPDSVIKEWSNIRHLPPGQRRKLLTEETFPPLIYFNQLFQEGMLTNALIVLDEFHKCFGKGFDGLILKLWGDWFSEVRHKGASFECVTQSLEKLSPEYLSLCAIRTNLIAIGDRCDPFFRVRMYDYYEVRAAWCGEYTQKIEHYEYLKVSSDTGKSKWKKNIEKCYRFTIDPVIFPLYRSFDVGGGESGEATPPHVLYGKKVVFWFLRRNWWNFFWRFLVVLFFLWVTMGGGMVYGIQLFTSFMTRAASANKVVQQDKKIILPSVSSVSSGSLVSPGSSVSLPPSGKDFKKPLDSKDIDSSIKLKELELKKIELEAQMKEKDKLDKEKLSFVPSMFFNSQVWLRSGLKISIGYTFKGGIYAGKTVVEINDNERFYTLDDGTAVHMFD